MVTPTDRDPYAEPPLDEDALRFVRIERGPGGEEVVYSLDGVMPSDPPDQPDPAQDVDLEESETDPDPDDTVWEVPR